MESGKIPPFVWAIAAAVVVALALLARRSSGASQGGGSILVTHPPSDAAIASEGDTDRVRIGAQLGAFQTLAGAITGISVADTVAKRDIAVTSLSTQAVSYAAAVESVTRQTEAGYGYWGQLAEQEGETQRTRIGAERDISLGTIAADLARVLGFRQAESDDLYTREQFGTARHIANEETSRSIFHDRTNESINQDDNRTQRYLGDEEGRTTRYLGDRGVDVAREQGQTARYVAKKQAGHWYDNITKGVGDFIGGGGVLKFFGL